MDFEEESEHTLLVVREVNVYKVPPQNTSGGYKCADWLVSSKLWSGRLRVVAVKDTCEIRLEDTTNGELFATCRVLPGQREATVQNAVDSSRYFVLKIDDGRGRHAFIGLGFNERNEAFDFNVALSDHQKHVMNAKSQPPSSQGQSDTPSSTAAPSSDFKLKEGQTITINVKPKSNTTGEKKLSLAGGGGGLKPLAPPASGGGFRLAPPPGGGGLKLAPPPPANTASVPSLNNNKQQGGSSAGGWMDF